MANKVNLYTSKSLSHMDDLQETTPSSDKELKEEKKHSEKIRMEKSKRKFTEISTSTSPVLSTTKVHLLPMKGTEYFNFIMQGKKKFEGRVYGGTCRNMKVGDCLRMVDKRAGWGIDCEITDKDVYKSFYEMLREKGVIAMLPQLESLASMITPEELLLEGVKIYERFPLSHRVKKLGAVAIGIKFLRKFDI